MENSNQTSDVLKPQPSKNLPGILNVLTILTFIGCGIAYLSDCYNFFINNNPDKQIEKLNQTRDKMGDSGFGAKMIDSSIDMIQKSHDNRYLLFITGLIFTTLCLIGAMQMRKLKKTGYYYYLIGELAPFVLMAGLFGSSFFSAFTILFIALIAIVFVILYSTQLKYLQNK
jgi:magnesium-transporting ATPase (P-type)